GSRRPVGKVGETRSVFPGLSIGDRACAVRRGSAQPTVHKFTAPPRHRVRRPVPSTTSSSSACGGVKKRAKAALLFDAVGGGTVKHEWVYLRPVHTDLDPVIPQHIGELV